MRLWWLALLLAPCCVLAAPSATLQVRADELVSAGYDRPDEALAAIDRFGAGDDMAARRTLLLARGLIAARAGREQQAHEVANDLRKSATADPLARADAELVRAQLADTLGRHDAAADHAQAALSAYEPVCDAAAACDPRSPWRALLILHNRALLHGNLVLARSSMQRAQAVARAAGDLFRQAWSEAALASLAAALGEFDLARRQLAQAQRLAALHGGPLIAARVKMNEARIAAAHDDTAGALRAYEQALPLAHAARSPRLAAVLLGNLSDAYVKAGRPGDALRAVEQALPTVRKFNERRAERVLLHNGGLARIGLGQLADGRRDLERALALWAESGAAGDQAIALREFGNALSSAGDAPGALELYHRERKVVADIRAANRDSALRELQARYDSEAKQRNIELLERDNALMTARLANRTLSERLWLLVGTMLALAIVLAALLYLRVRDTQRRLVHSHALLRVQSERDPLTALANRRHFQDAMRVRGAHERFDGALLLVDMDHFKQINDRHGHAAGDQVLVELARRLADAVRSDDLVVRWGGEEFLVFAPRVEAAQVDALAERVLHAVGDAPVSAGDSRIAVTASIGYGRFPLPPHHVPLTWEQAVNLADMALYTAKSQGRNRAVGIAACTAPQPEALQAVEADFERAWTEGRVTLALTPGPAA
jgi:diguanylate cyclase (GGDEF)-like protein